MLDQDSSLYLISLNIIITCVLNNLWDIKGRTLMLLTSGSERVNLFMCLCNILGGFKEVLCKYTTNQWKASGNH